MSKETTNLVKRVARAVREEIVRQYRDDDRGRCPAGAAYYEEHIGPGLIAFAAIDAMREPTEEMLIQGDDGIVHALETAQVLAKPWVSPAEYCWRAMIGAANGVSTNER